MSQRPPTQPSGPHAVAVLVSRTNFEDATIEVAGYSGSANAPAVAPGSSCAQALADLLNQQFRLQEVLTGGNPSVTVYLLVRPQG